MALISPGRGLVSYDDREKKKKKLGSFRSGAFGLFTISVTFDSPFCSASCLGLLSWWLFVFADLMAVVEIWRLNDDGIDQDTQV